LTAALGELSRQAETSLSVTLLAAFQTLLLRYTQQDDLVIRTEVPFRHRPPTGRAAGPPVNAVLLRADLSGNPTFREYLGRAGGVVSDALANQDFPFEALLKELHNTETALGPPYPVAFRLTTEPPAAVPRGGPCLDLRLDAEDHPDGLRCRIDYAAELFDGATIDRLLSHFEALLAGVAADPDRHLDALPLMAAAERAGVLARAGARRSFPLPAASLPELFERQADRSPGAVAVVSGDRRLTYRELNERSNRLAHHLRKRGVGPNVLVGLCVDRSADLVVALLGILKAGGAYVPVDPNYPKGRREHILGDARVKVLVTEPPLTEGLRGSGPEVVCLAADSTAIAAESPANLGRRTGPDDLAYAIYTSGSTGRPKGSPISHGNVLRLFAATQPWFAFGPEDVWTLFHSFAFDFSVWELWGALFHGGRLVVVPHSVSRAADKFYELLRRERVTVLNQTPSAFRALMGVEETRGVKDLALRLVIFGGEALDLVSLKPWFARHGDERPRLVNMYGITETTVHVTYRPLRQGDVEAAPGSVIGVPIPDLQVYLLDARQEPVPPGAVGEIYVGGAGVGRGYLNRPELTARRFLANPFGADPGTRLYRSGDLARRLADGGLVYLGRIDHQVKVRGFRVELGEVEAVLGGHPAVREVVVLARESAHGDTRLVAYVVARREVTPQELRRHAQRGLPEAMVPSFVFLEALPLTANGKVDRAALPPPGGEVFRGGAPHRPPRDDLEARLAALWEETLGVGPIGRDDSFFDLGGHSLLAARLFAAVERVCGARLPLAALFRAPTVGLLGELIRAGGWEPAWSPLVPIQPHGDHLPLFLVHAVGGHVLSYIPLARHLGRGQPVFGLQARGLDGRQAPLERVEDLAALYVDEVRRRQPHGPYHLGGLSFGGLVAFEMARQLWAGGEAVGLLTLLDTSAPGYRHALRHRLAGHWGEMRGLPPGERWRYLPRALARALRLGRRGAGAVPEAYRRVEAANRQAARAYVPQAYPGRLTLFRALDRPPQEDQDDPRRWGEWAAGGVEIYDVPGSHASFHAAEPFTRVLAERLAGCLRRAREAHHGFDTSSGSGASLG
jgi:amino acid adenylation domain-containing protein